MSEIFAQILLPLAFDRTFTYLAEKDVEIGDVVQVEFGRKKIWGVVMSLDVEAATEIPAEKIKKILGKNSYLKLSRNHLQFIEAISSYNLAACGMVVRAFIGILNSDKTKKISARREQKIKTEKFFLKNLSHRQQEIADGLSALIKNQSSVSLLDGITGSGKTEIYFALVAEMLASSVSSQILILLPEIALTSQLTLRFQEQFGFAPELWHSKISKKEKREIFFGVVNGSVRVLIGARSALLLPFKNLQLIVVDEEHDSSFKQEDVFNFHARDMAILKARLENFSVVLSSATPALETYANALSGKYNHFVLEQKFGQKNEIELVDLCREKLPAGNFLSQKLCAEIAGNLANKKQILLFLNRRGYAPVTLCKACGKKSECPDCDFHLVLHKAKNKLICHHCGHQEKPESRCKSCGEEDSLISLGVGVEKLEEEVSGLFPKARYALLTSDNVGDFVAADKMIKKILNNEIDIIIGTQMIAKGYDFPNLALVGIVDADSLFYSSELRSLERAYQMLMQVMGRAGRKERGKVLIQTYNPQNLIFEKITTGNKKDFYDFEIKNRQSLDLPPFSRMARFEVSSFLESDAKNFARKLIQHFPCDEKIQLLGPAPAPLQRLRNRHHFIINLKAQKKVNLQKLISDIMQNLAIPNRVRVRIDIDPL